MQTKVCTKCGEEKPITEENFSKRNDNKDGFRKYCRTCELKQKKNYYKNNKDKFIEYYKQNNIKKSEYDKEYYRKEIKIQQLALNI